MDTAYSLVLSGSNARIRDWLEVELSNTFAADLLDEVKLHCRIQQSVEDPIVLRYINAGLRAAENYLHKDIFPRTVTFRWLGGGKLFVYAGEIRSLAIHTGTSPDEVDALDLIQEYGSRAFKGGGLFLVYNGGAYLPVLEESDGDLFVSFETGFLSADAILDEIVLFVMEFVGMFYVNRELGGIGTITYQIDAMPAYLLDPLAHKVIV